MDDEPTILNPRSLASCDFSKYSKLNEPLSISRRDFLKFFSLVALDSTPAFDGLVSKISSTSVEILTSHNQVIFKLGSITAWVINTSDFGGTPKLKTTRKNNQVKIELTNAVLPGSDISADFTCHLTRELFDWRLNLILFSKLLPDSARAPIFLNI